MSISKLLIANRGEIAVRIQRAAAALDIATVAVYSEDDAQGLHVFRADYAHALTGAGAAAYLDIAQIIAATRTTDCDAIHPGYGFLSENAAFARACEDARLTFIGPRADVLEKLGDKVNARNIAKASGVPVLPGSDGAVDLAGARAFLGSLDGGAMMIKAVSGGGGRGVRVVGTVAYWMKLLNGRPPKRPRPLATVRFTWSVMWPGRDISRCRSWATAPAGSAIWANVTAAFNGGTRKSSKSPRRQI